ncbi:hypothetical protein BZA05DRAFT_435083 [Tricharina praecox]|uniref:uncharacterized protein n=1 Tax=Tricharina praecox TaxID=43433 RepID=UPI00221F4539|nr:uncharacterized protein BZA05DRAFT_435083 [Tricharina praecox]KAI5854886.1 hypothetical protein BZA05DRAFT_435083 [Tricharina praecox]
MDDTDPPPPKPKSYLLTSALTPLGHALSLSLLDLGASLAACCTRTELSSPLLTTLRAHMHSGTLIILELDPLSASICQSALATAVAAFGRIDAVVHTGVPTFVGALEEMAPGDITRQFEAGYFGRVNVVKAALSVMRKQRGGHIVVVTGLTGAMGTPGLSLRSAADHGIEGLCDALAFEVAPFGIRVSIVQPGIETAVWGAGEVVVVKEKEEYRDLPGGEAARRVRGLAERVDKMGGMAEVDGLADTVRIVVEIVGSENPPGRVTVGEEQVEIVKERLKTLSEELEEYLEASLGADITAPPGQGGTGGRSRPVAGEIGDDYAYATPAATTSSKFVAPSNIAKSPTWVLSSLLTVSCRSSYPIPAISVAHSIASLILMVGTTLAASSLLKQPSLSSSSSVAYLFPRAKISRNIRSSVFTYPGKCRDRRRNRYRSCTGRLYHCGLRRVPKKWKAWIVVGAYDEDYLPRFAEVVGAGGLSLVHGGAGGGGGGGGSGGGGCCKLCDE